MKVSKKFSATVGKTAITFRMLEGSESKLIGFVSVNIRNKECSVQVEAPVFHWTNNKTGEFQAGIITNKDDYYNVTRKIDDTTIRLWAPNKELKNRINSWVTSILSKEKVSNALAPEPITEAQVVVHDTPVIEPEELGLAVPTTF